MVTTILDLLGALLIIAAFSVWMGILLGVPAGLGVAGVMVLVFSAVLTVGGRK